MVMFFLFFFLHVVLNVSSTKSFEQVFGNGFTEEVVSKVVHYRNVYLQCFVVPLWLIVWHYAILNLHRSHTELRKSSVSSSTG